MEAFGNFNEAKEVCSDLQPLKATISGSSDIYGIDTCFPTQPTMQLTQFQCFQ